MRKTYTYTAGNDIGLTMAIFLLENAFPIEMRCLPSGDMTVWHPINIKVQAIVESACRGRGQWNSKYNNWVIKAEFADTVLSEIASHTEKIA